MVKVSYNFRVDRVFEYMELVFLPMLLVLCKRITKFLTFKIFCRYRDLFLKRILTVSWRFLHCDPLLYLLGGKVIDRNLHFTFDPEVKVLDCLCTSYYFTLQTFVNLYLFVFAEI